MVKKSNSVEEPEQNPLAGDAGQGQPSPQQMMKALRKSGYIFEHEIAVALEGMGFYVERSFAFEDPDEGKSRELDIRGFQFAMSNKTYKMEIGVHLFFECKDSGSPFVFLQTAKHPLDSKNPEARECMFPASPTANTQFRLAEYGFQAQHHYYSEPKKSVQFAKIVRKGGEFSALHDNVYDSLLLPQAKAFQSFLGHRSHRHSSPYQSEHISLAFNAIVLRDHLFALDLDVPDAEPTPIGRASFLRQIESKGISGAYLFDFVTQAYLATYVKDEIGGLVKAIAQAFADNPMRFRSHGSKEIPPDPLKSLDGTPWGPGYISLRDL